MATMYLVQFDIVEAEWPTSAGEIRQSCKLCDGARHYAARPVMQSEEPRLLGPCDGSCQGGQRVHLGTFGAGIRRFFGLGAMPDQKLRWIVNWTVPFVGLWCDGKTHLKIRSRWDKPVAEPCDGSCHNPPNKQAVEHWVDAQEAPWEVQVALDLAPRVPDEFILVRIHTGDSGPAFTYGWDAFTAGQQVDTKSLLWYHLLAEGESFDQPFPRYDIRGNRYWQTTRFANVGGQVKVLDGDAERRREFAQSQRQLLLACGFTSREASRIMQAAGPGQVREALEWGLEAMEAYQTLGRAESFGAFLEGVRGPTFVGKDRTADNIRHAGLPVPPSARSTARQFFGVLSGVRALNEAGLAGKVEQAKAALVANPLGR